MFFFVGNSYVIMMIKVTSVHTLLVNGNSEMICVHAQRSNLCENEKIPTL